MIRICPLSELPPGEALCVDIEPPIAVFHTEDGEIFAVDDTCTHQDASLAEGWVEGCEVGVDCDHQGRTSLPGVVAVGDCASWHDVRLGRRHRVEHWTGAMERPAIAVAALLRGGVQGDLHSEDRHVALPYFWSDQYDVRVQFAGHAAEADSVTIEEGSAESGSLLAVYRCGEAPVGVLGMNQSRLFGRWRRQLNAASAV